MKISTRALALAGALATSVGVACGTASSPARSATPSGTVEAVAPTAPGKPVEPHPLAPSQLDWTIDFGPQRPDSQGIPASTKTPPSLTIVFNNSSASSFTADYDFFVIRDADFKPASSSRPPAFGDFPQGVWDYDEANPASHSALTAPGTERVTLSWPVTDRSGNSVSPGKYDFYIVVTKNGALDGVATGSFDVH